ncbi:MAG: sigma-70 family RNA polymerase sigma factor [Lentisphaeraceae bacterium]|nr:sigma-70 family RNA polymerase sigma factor [Lentisphaeraceae bacterium]
MIENDDKQEFCPTRHTLLVRVRNKNDHKSWEEFVFYYEKFIYIICRKFGLGHHDCQEAVQKVLLKLWSQLPEFEYKQGSRFRGWVYTLTSFVVKDHYKKYKQEKEREQKALDYAIWNPDLKLDADLEKHIELEWQNYMSNLALEAIRPKFSEKVLSIFLSHNQGRSVKEMSEEFNIPTNTVYVYIQRVTKRLAQEIKNLCRELS